MTRRNILDDRGADADGAAPAPPAAIEPDPSGMEARLRVLPDPERDLVCCRLPLTHLGNAERWRVRYGRDFRLCPEIGWFGWDSTRWQLLSEDQDAPPQPLILSIARMVRAIRMEAALVAASGYPQDGMSAAELERVQAWADHFGTTSRELYLAGDEESGGARARWLESLDRMDEIVGKMLWSQRIAQHAKASETGGTVSQVLRWIRGFPDVVVRPEVFDTEKLAINVANGTLRLVRKPEKRASDAVAAGASEWRTGDWKMQLFPHRREDMITKLAPVPYSPRARCPSYDAFLAEVQPDPEMRRFLHQWGGYSLTGDTGEHKLAFFYGEGRNGKGTWVEAIAHLAGDYAGSIGIESLIDSGVKRRGDQATPDLAELPGVRFLRVSEPQVGMRFNDGLLKQLTGGDPVKARHLNKGFFQYFPDFKLTISGNVRPPVKDVSHGMWSRMRLIPWDRVIAEDAIDTGLPARLRAEASGILNRLVEGLIDWRMNGLIMPEAVTVATRAYREDSDLLGRFLAECCEVGDDPRAVRVNATVLWDCFDAWRQAVGGSEWKRQGFVKAMRDRRFEQIQSNGVWWIKLQLRPGVTIDGLRAGVWPGRDDAAPAPPAGSVTGSGSGTPPRGGLERGAGNGEADPWGFDD